MAAHISTGTALDSPITTTKIRPCSTKTATPSHKIAVVAAPEVPALAAAQSAAPAAPQNGRVLGTAFRRKLNRKLSSLPAGYAGSRANVGQASWHLACRRSRNT